MTITIDRSIYSDNCISNVVYWFSEKYTIKRSLSDNLETITICSDEELDEKAIKCSFLQKMNDYKLREIVEERTKDIRIILYAKAFGEFEDLTEEEIIE